MPWQARTLLTSLAQMGGKAQIFTRLEPFEYAALGALARLHDRSVAGEARVALRQYIAAALPAPKSDDPGGRAEVFGSSPPEMASTSVSP